MAFSASIGRVPDSPDILTLDITDLPDGVLPRHSKLLLLFRTERQDYPLPIQAPSNFRQAFKLCEPLFLPKDVYNSAVNQYVLRFYSQVDTADFVDIEPTNLVTYYREPSDLVMVGLQSNTWFKASRFPIDDPFLQSSHEFGKIHGDYDAFFKKLLPAVELEASWPSFQSNNTSIYTASNYSKRALATSSSDGQKLSIKLFEEWERVFASHVADIDSAPDAFRLVFDLETFFRNNKEVHLSFDYERHYDTRWSFAAINNVVPVTRLTTGRGNVTSNADGHRTYVDLSIELTPFDEVIVAPPISLNWTYSSVVRDFRTYSVVDSIFANYTDLVSDVETP